MSHISLLQTIGKSVFLVFLLVLLAGVSQVLGAEGITGDWEVTTDFNSRQIFARLSISKRADGTLVGSWGESELSDIKFEDHTITFVRVRRWRDQEFKMTYEGTLKDGKLVGKLTSDRGSFPANGARIKTKPTILGKWDIKMTFRDREVSFRLSVSQKLDGTLAGTWTSRRGESQLSDIKFEKDKLIFTRKRTYQGQEIVSTYEGAVEGNKLIGKFTSSRGTIPANGQRVGVELIGKWKLTTTSQRGPRTRTLTIYPDLTGRYQLGDGEVAIKDLKLEGDQLTFEIEMGFGERQFLMRFKGKLVGASLKGQFNTPRGSREVIAKKFETASASDAHPNFSRDDSQLVYMSDGEIKIVEIASGKVTNLTNSPTADMCPDWSNDGATIVFDSKREDVNRDLYIMAINGTNVKRLTNEPNQQDKCPAFSPDDSRITYICTANGDMDIFVMNSDGSGVKNLTNDPGSDRCPSWTPDGKKITFMSNRTGFFEVYIMDSDDGSNLKQLTELKIKGSNCWVAAVSPDGKQVCFVGDHEENNDLYVMDIDGKNVRNLTQHKANDQWPAWSHDGEWIAFASTRSGKERLYVIHPEGTGLRQVTGLENNQILE